MVLFLCMPAKGPYDLQKNKELAEAFRKMAQCYQYLGTGDRFRAIAYNTASRTISNMKDPLESFHDNIKELDQLKGVGESIAEKIVEFLHTGKVKKFEELQQKVPLPLLELMDIQGMGPSTVRLLHEKGGITTKEDLIHALEQQQLTGIKGIGSGKIKMMEQVLKLQHVKERMPLAVAEVLGKKVLNALQQVKGIEQAVLAGSLRRKKETIGDIDIICTAPDRQRKRITSQIKAFSFVEKILAAGLTKVSFTLKNNQMQVDIRIVHPSSFGAALLYFTGSKEHNIQLRTFARNRGMKINEYGVFDEKNGKLLAAKTEKEVYALLGFRYIEPEQRLGRSELKENRVN
jgi:DNA polymerase (family X)